MTCPENNQTSSAELYRPIRGRAVEIYELSEEILTQDASARSATGHEIRELIEALLEHLPDDEKQTFKQRIMTEGMI